MSVSYQSKELAVVEADNPRSVVNLVPPSVKEAIERVPDELLGLSDAELERRVSGGQWTLVDRRLRTAFWIEYNRAQETGSNINVSNVFSGICSRPYFYSKFIQDKVRLAHLLLPPAQYESAMEEALTFGIERMREILAFPIYDDDGKPNTKAADVIIKAVQMIDQRRRGAVVQKNLNVNVDAGKAGAASGEGVESMEELDRRLAELEGEAHAVKKTLPREIVIQAVSFPEPSEPEDNAT